MLLPVHKVVLEDIYLRKKMQCLLSRIISIKQNFLEEDLSAICFLLLENPLAIMKSLHALSAELT